MLLDTTRAETDDDGGLMRLNRYCALCGLGSRRFCDTIIASGKILLNGKRVIEHGNKIDPRRDTVHYEGRTLRPLRPYTCLAYHKPRGVMVTKSDPEGRPTVYEALKRAGHEADDLRYIGRLDFNSEGLLLLTNDGALVHALTHPRYHIKKVYEVCINKKLAAADAARMRDEGVASEGQLLRVGAVSAMNGTAEGRWYSIDLYEGKKRQIRRIFEALGYAVVRLKRVQFASVKTGDLRPGAARTLTMREVAALKAAGYGHSKGKRACGR